MSAKELGAKVGGVTSDLGIIELNTRSNLRRLTDALTVMQSIDSNSPDVAIALQGLLKIHKDMEQMINDLQRTSNEVDNYRWSIG